MNWENQRQVQRQLVSPFISLVLSNDGDIKDTNCIQNNPSQSACLNKNCKQYAFTCRKQTCQCRNQHKSCFMIETKTLLKNFSQKVLQIKPLINSIEDEFNKLIDKISDSRDNLLKEVLIIFENYGLNEKEKEVYKSIKAGETQEITGAHVWKACFNQVQEKVQNFDRLIAKINESFEQHLKGTQVFFQAIKMDLEDYELENRTRLSGVSERLISLQSIGQGNTYGIRPLQANQTDNNLISKKETSKKKKNEGKDSLGKKRPEQKSKEKTFNQIPTRGNIFSYQKKLY